MLGTGSAIVDAERAFVRAARARRRAAIARRVRRAPARRGLLPVYDERAVVSARARPGRGLREIRGTLEPSRARLFDGSFRPAAAVRQRWQRVWLAEHRGAVLPPISVVPLADGYAVRDGHHRVSVAHARGALTIDAQVDATI